MKLEKQKAVAVELKFGDFVFGEFPFSDGGSKNRWVFVVEDLGDAVLVVYCTTNPAWPNSVRLGQLQDGKVTHLVPNRWEIVRKTRLAVGRLQRIPLPVPGVGDLVLRWMTVLSREGMNGNPAGLPRQQAENFLSQLGHYKMIMEGQARKIAEKAKAYRK